MLKPRSALFKGCRAANDVKKIAGEAGTQTLRREFRATLAGILSGLFRAFNAALFALVAEDLNEHWLSYIIDPDLILDSSYERFFSELVELQIGSENDHDFERNSKSNSGPEGKRINPPVQRDNPPIQQLAGLDVLAPEIINYQNAVIGHHGEWRQTHSRHLIDSRLEHLGAQFAADAQERTMAENPASVHILRLLWDSPMNNRIIDAQDLPGHFDRKGDVHAIIKDSGEALADARFPVASGSVQKE